MLGVIVVSSSCRLDARDRKLNNDVGKFGKVDWLGRLTGIRISFRGHRHRMGFWSKPIDHALADDRHRQCGQDLFGDGFVSHVGDRLGKFEHERSEAVAD